MRRKKYKVRLKDDALQALFDMLDESLGVATHASADLTPGSPSVSIGPVKFVTLAGLGNVEAEAGLLGALMIENRLVDDVSLLRPDHFLEPRHGEIYAKIVEIAGTGKVANPVTLKPFFHEREDFDDLGGAGYLAQLTGSGAAIIGARDFAAQIIDLSNLRRARAVLLKGVDRLEDTSEEIVPATIVADIEAELSMTIEQSGRKASMSVGQAADEAVKHIEEISAGKEPAGFLLKGFDDWNHVRGRMEGGEFDLLGARPSMGKTATSIRIARCAAEAGVGVEYLSLEMKREIITVRILADMIYRQGESCTYEQLKAGRLSRDDWRRMGEAKEHLATLPLAISDDPLMVEDVAPFLRKRKRWHEKSGTPMRLVVLDYLGRLESRRKFNSDTELTAYISRTLKSVAKELDVCLIALAQLNRGLEARENKRPMLSDLRQSGSLEQDADNVIFLYRDEYYLEKTEPARDKVEKWEKWADEMNQVRDDMEIYSSKRREGALSKRIAKFYTRHQAVRDHGDYAAAPSFFDDDDPMSMPEMRG